MARPVLVSLIKPLEATKLNPRGVPLPGPDVTIFYGSLIEYVGQDHDRERFKYLNELYSCKRDAYYTATGTAKPGKDAPAPAEDAARPSAAATAAAPAPAKDEEEMAAAAPAAAPASGPALAWIQLDSNAGTVRRAAIPGGWLVALSGTGLTFVPDPKHQWDGGSTQ